MAHKKIATLILNRNLPQVTDAMVAHLQKWNGEVTDIYVIESGSDPDKLSRHASFIADWPEAKTQGLHYCRGFNYGLLELDKKEKYDYYFFVCNDAVFPDQPTLHTLLEKMEQYPKLGIISPLSSRWGEAKYFSEKETLKCVWLIPHVCWLFRRSFLDTIIEKKDPTFMNYFYDGNNFRGYDADTEIIIKAYLNDWAVAVTSEATFYEQADLTDQNAEVMKTERRALHERMMFEEGLAWMKQKYGFASKLEMRAWAQRVYAKFFRRNREYRQFKL